MAAVKKAGRPAKKVSNTVNTMEENVGTMLQEDTLNNSFNELDGDNEISMMLKDSGISEEQLARMSRNQLENMSSGLSNSRDAIDMIEREGIKEGVTGYVNPLLNIGYSRKLPDVRARNPEKVHLFWAASSTNATFPIPRLRANGCDYAQISDLADDFGTVSALSQDMDCIKIEEMVLMKTPKKHWEQMMKHLHNDLPAQNQEEIFNKNSKFIKGGMQDNAARDDVAFNPYRAGSIYGAAQVAAAPKSGSWKHIAE
jgi:hypothetical protein